MAAASAAQSQFAKFVSRVKVGCHIDADFSVENG